MAIELPGIPISEEQCIGDSLPSINGAFQLLRNGINNISDDISNKYLLKTDFVGFLPITGGTLTGPIQVGQINTINSACKITLGKTINSSETALPTIYCGSVNGQSPDLYINGNSVNSKIILGTGNGGAERIRITNDGIGMYTGTNPEAGVVAEINGLVSIKANSSNGYGLVMTKSGQSATNNTDRLEFQLDTMNPIAYIGTANFGTGVARALGLKTGNTEKIRITTEGNVGIGINTPLHRLHVSGSGLITSTLEVGSKLIVKSDIQADGNVTAFNVSDSQLKTNIVQITKALEKISAISGYEYEWNEELQSSYTGRDTGVIAQEIETVCPLAVKTKSDGYKAVCYEKLIPLLIESIKELTEEVNKLKAAQTN